MKEKLFTNEKETKRAIKAAVDQFRKVLKYENNDDTGHRRTSYVSRGRKS